MTRRAAAAICGVALAFCASSSPAYAQREPGFPQAGGSYEMMEPGTLATARLPQLLEAMLS